jgi:branched-subunit amino acid aminotransferase/4-amino-4-deoxychorismate lyase
VLELAPQMGIPIEEGTLKLADLYQADEVFMTSTTREVQPIARIEEHTFAAPGPVTTRFAQAFADYVKRYFAAQKEGKTVTA